MALFLFGAFGKFSGAFCVRPHTWFFLYSHISREHIAMHLHDLCNQRKIKSIILLRVLQFVVLSNFRL